MRKKYGWLPFGIDYILLLVDFNTYKSEKVMIWFVCFVLFVKNVSVNWLTHAHTHAANDLKSYRVNSSRIDFGFLHQISIFLLSSSSFNCTATLSTLYSGYHNEQPNALCLKSINLLRFVNEFWFWFVINNQVCSECFEWHKFICCNTKCSDSMYSSFLDADQQPHRIDCYWISNLLFMIKENV